MRWNLAYIFLLVLLSNSLVFAKNSKTPAPDSDWNFIERKLKAEKFSKSFIAQMKQHYEKEDFLKVVELNTLLFLRTQDYHGPQVTDEAVSAVQVFLKNNTESFKKAETQYQVPASVIGSLLWIETRHGQNLGEFHVPSVYLHLVQANRTKLISYLRSQALEYTDRLTKIQKTEIAKRTRKKAIWAMTELKAIAKANQKKWTNLNETRGSFAGAFGFPQFLPSSYMEWARTDKPSSPPNLLNKRDSILSVAFYLKDNGWKNAKPKSHIKALKRYNNSDDYAQAILQLAQKVEEQMGLEQLVRQPASTKNKSKKR